MRGNLIAAAGTTLLAMLASGPVRAASDRESQIARARELHAAADDEADAAKKRGLLEECRGVVESIVAPLSEEAARDRRGYEQKQDEWRGRTPPQTLRMELRRLLEKAASSMQRHCAMLLECAEVGGGSSAVRREFAGRALEVLEREHVFYESAERMFGAVLWIEYATGRAHALAGRYEEACRRGFDLVLLEDPARYRGQALSYVNELRMLAFYMKAKAAFDLGRGEEAIAVVDAMFSPAPRGYPDALSDDRGNAAALIKARALVQLERPGCQAAIDQCVRVISGGGGGWPAQAGEVLATILARGGTWPTDVAVLRHAALGTYRLSQREEGERRSARLEQCIRLYEKVIEGCRRSDAPLRLRLETEPAAWLELGVCYTKLSLWEEAGLAFEGVVRRFAKKTVVRELARLPSLEGAWRRIRSAGQSDPYEALYDAASRRPGLAEVLSDIDEKLRMSSRNLMVVARRRMGERPGPVERERYLRAARTAAELDPSVVPVTEFQMAAWRSAEAEVLCGRGRPAEAVRAWADAGELYLRAASAGGDLRGAASHAAGTTFYRAMSEAQKLGRDEGDAGPGVADLGRRALKAFALYERHVATAPAQGADAAVRRRRVEETSAARPVIHLALGDRRAAIDSADAYLEGGGRDERYAPGVAWTRLRAICEVAIDAVGTPEEAGAVERIAAAADGMRGSSGPRRYYLSACRLAAATFAEAQKKLAALGAGGPEDDRAALAARSRAYGRRCAEWQKRILDLNPHGVKELGPALSVADVFFENGLFEDARGLYRRILDEHDPSRVGRGREFAEDYFDQAARTVVLPEESATDEVRAKIRSLAELVLGDRAGGRTAERGRGCDWLEARRLCEEVLRERPTVRCRRQLQDVRDEMAFRLRLLGAKLHLAECCSALAEKGGDAGALWDEASHMFEQVREHWSCDNELRLRQAECSRALGRREDALRLCSEAAAAARDYSPVYYRAQALASRILFEEGDYERCRAIAYVIASSHKEEEWEPHFPDARELARRCDEELGRPTPAPGADLDTSYPYEAPLPSDRWLVDELKTISARISCGLVGEQSRAQWQRDAFEAHFRRLVRGAIEDPVAAARAGRIGKDEVRAGQKMLLARLLYQSPFGYRRLRELAVSLGLLASAGDPMPPRYFTGDAARTAIQLGLLTAAGERKPIGEIPADLLRRESQ